MNPLTTDLNVLLIAGVVLGLLSIIVLVERIFSHYTIKHIDQTFKPLLSKDTKKQN